MMTSKYSASDCQQMPGTRQDSKVEVAEAARKLRRLQSWTQLLWMSLSPGSFKFVKYTGIFIWVIYLEVARNLHLKSCHWKIWMAKTNLWDHRSRHRRSLLTGPQSPWTVSRKHCIHGALSGQWRELGINEFPEDIFVGWTKEILHVFPDCEILGTIFLWLNYAVLSH